MRNYRVVVALAATNPFVWAAAVLALGLAVLGLAGLMLYGLYWWLREEFSDSPKKVVYPPTPAEPPPCHQCGIALPGEHACPVCAEPRHSDGVTNGDGGDTRSAVQAPSWTPTPPGADTDSTPLLTEPAPKKARRPAAARGPKPDAATPKKPAAAKKPAAKRPAAAKGRKKPAARRKATPAK